MSPTAMLTLMFAAFAMFTWSASRRWRLMQIGQPANRLDHIAARLRGTWRYAFRQEKMDYYNPAGMAHKLIFTGFVLLNVREMILWGRGYFAPFNMWVFGPGQAFGPTFEFVKDCLGLATLAGTSVFFYYRVVVKPKRMALTFEGLLIICIISTLMLTDMAYDGASLALAAKQSGFCEGLAHAGSEAQCAAIATITAPLQGERWQGEWTAWPGPAASFFAMLFHGQSPRALVWASHSSFWLHEALIFLFLNLLPHSKHFHIITAIPNVFLRSLHPAGRLEPMAENAEKLMEKVGAAAEAPDPLALPIGVARIDQFSWKAILDFYTCTECGRCSDNCPAHRTGRSSAPNT